MLGILRIQILKNQLVLIVTQGQGLIMFDLIQGDENMTDWVVILVGLEVLWWITVSIFLWKKLKNKKNKRESSNKTA